MIAPYELRTEKVIGLALGRTVQVHAPAPGPGHDHHGETGTLAAKLEQPAGMREWWVRLHGSGGGGGFAWLPGWALLPIREATERAGGPR